MAAVNTVHVNKCSTRLIEALVKIGTSITTRKKQADRKICAVCNISKVTSYVVSLMEQLLLKLRSLQTPYKQNLSNVCTQQFRLFHQYNQ